MRLCDACQVFDAKRLIGRKFADPIVQADIKLWPFKVIAGQGDKPMIVVNAQGEEKKFHPEEVSSMVLLKMKETAEAYLGTKVNDAAARLLQIRPFSFFMQLAAITSRTQTSSFIPAST